MVNKVPVRAIRLILDVYMNFYSAFGDTCELLPAATATGGAGSADASAADDDAGHRALRLQIEHVDHIAFGAPFHRLAANGEIEAGGFVNQGDIVVALHQIRLGEIGDP